jgi:hypothetical protein
MKRHSAAAPDLILFGLFLIAVTVPTYFAMYRLGHGLPPTPGYYLVPSLGLFLVVAGIYGRTWRARWGSRP